MNVAFPFVKFTNLMLVMSRFPSHWVVWSIEVSGVVPSLAKLPHRLAAAAASPSSAPCVSVVAPVTVTVTVEVFVGAGKGSTDIEEMLPLLSVSLSAGTATGAAADGSAVRTPSDSRASRGGRARTSTARRARPEVGVADR